MALWKIDSKINTSDLSKKSENSFLEIIQQGLVYTPSRLCTLDATNIAHLSKAVIPIKTNYVGDENYHYFDVPPQLLATRKNGITVEQVGETVVIEESWKDFFGTTKILYDGTNWIEEVRFALVDPTQIRICVLTMRLLGTITGMLGSNSVYFYLVSPSSNAMNVGGRGWGGNVPEGKYVLWDTIIYDENLNVSEEKSGSFETGSWYPATQIDSWKENITFQDSTE